VQRIANLIVLKDNQVLLLKKPRRDWYVAPGGKMEQGESIYLAQLRIEEETNTHPHQPHLKGIYTMIIQEQDEVIIGCCLHLFLIFSCTLMKH
jgi:8-oxo-dGTP diphosphatase